MSEQSEKQKAPPGVLRLKPSPQKSRSNGKPASARLQDLFNDLEREPAVPGQEEAYSNTPPVADAEPPPAPLPGSVVQPSTQELPPPTSTSLNNLLNLPFLDRGSLAIRANGGNGDHSKQVEQVLPAAEPLTPFPWESLYQGRPIVENARTDGPSLLAYGRRLTPAGSASLETPEGLPALLLEVLDDDPGRIWSEDEIMLVEQVTDQLSLALENARLFEEARLRAEQLAKLNEIGLGLTSTLEVQPLLNLIMQSAVDILNSEAGSLFLIDPQTDELVFEVVLGPVASDLTGRRLAPGTGFAGQSALTGKALIANNVRSNKAWSAMTDGQTGYKTECLMVAPMLIKDRPVGVIEVINKRDGTNFTQADQELLAAFTTQATIAIENARLYTEELRRRQIADSLSGIARTISSALDVQNIAEQTLEQLAGLITYTFASIHLIHRTQGGKPETIAVRSSDPTSLIFPENLMEQALKSRHEYLVLDSTQDPEAETLLAGGILSWIAAPLTAGDEVVGLLTAGHRQPRAFQPEDLDLIHPVAAQIAVAIQNARLFEQTQTARDLLQVSVRYQKSIAQSVAALTERGAAALSEVLEQLGQAAQASRAYYMETQVDGRGPYWRLIAEWRAPEVASQLSNPTLRRLPAKDIERWIKWLRLQGFNVAMASGALDDERAYFETTGTRTALQFAVSGRLGMASGIAAEIPGCIGFDQIGSDRYWTTEEIAALQTAASALSNTFAREDLFSQVQANLAETEAQYHASARFNAANTYADILQVLRQHTVLGNANATEVSLYLFDRVWKQGPTQASERPEWLIPIARWSAQPDKAGLNETEQLTRQPIGQYSSNEQLLHPERPTVVMDLVNDPRLDEATRQFFLEQMNARSLLYMPLNVSGRWIGHLIATYRQTIGFAEHELRRLTSLAGQAAVAVEGLRLVEETRQRNEELATINQITNAVSRTLDPGEVLAEILIRVLSAIDYESGLISQVETHTQRLTLAEHQNLPEAMTRRLNMHGLDNTPCDLVFRSGQLIYQSNLELPPDNLEIQGFDAAGLASILQTPLKLGFHSYIGVPLVSKGATLGTICAFNKDVKAISPSRLSLLSAVGQQLGVVVENARLYQESQRRARQLQTAAEIARDTTSTLALDDLLSRSVSLLSKRFGFYHTSIYLLDDEGKQAVVRGSSGVADTDILRSTNNPISLVEQGYRLPVGGRSVVGQVTAAGQPVLLNDVRSEAGQEFHQPNPLLPLTRAELGLPLKIGDRVIGALEVQASQPNAISEDDLAVLQTLTDQIAVAVDNARSYELAKKAVEEISEAERLKTQFLANMSHELRTPLNSIIGFSRVILKGIDGPITEQQTQDLNAIYNSGQHLLGLINDVLDLSKIEAGKMEMARADDVNLVEIINSVMSTTVGLVKDKPIQLKQNLAPDLPRLSVDPMKIRQVLINLLSNAAKFTEKGLITVEARLLESSELAEYNAKVPSVIVKVSDTGPGITPADQAKLFQPFSQVDGSLTRKTGGSGLGLSICQHLIRMHGGEIDLDKRVTDGSVFYFTLPLGQTENAEALSGVPSQSSPDSPDQQPANPASTSKFSPPQLDSGLLSTSEEIGGKSEAGAAPRQVLVIEQDPQLTDIYRRYLAGHDCSVLALTELDQVVPVARILQPFAITLDVAMQGAPSRPPGIADKQTLVLDGWKVLQMLKADPDTQSIPIIVCSVVAQQKRAQELGASDYLLKPILEADLIHALEQIQP